MSRRISVFLAATALLAALAPPAYAAGIAIDDAYAVDEDTALTVDALTGVLVNDLPPTSVTAELVTGPTHEAAFALNGDGSFAYTPEANFNGTDAFTYLTRDALNEPSNTATVTITVNPVDDPSVANDDSANVPEDATDHEILVLANDADVEGDAFVVIGVTQGARGLAEIGADGLSVLYTPDQDATGADTFTYTITGGDAATVSVTIAGTNDTPVTSGQGISATEDQDEAIELTATDADGDTITFTPADPDHGTVTLGPRICSGTPSSCTQDVTYDPDPNYFGADSFTYTVTDGTATSDPVTVTITVAGVQDPPSAANDPLAATEDGLDVTIDPRGNDVEVDGQALAVTAVSQGAKGTVTFTAGSVTYDPAANAFGTDTFTYTVSDGSGGTDTATVNVTIAAVNDAPVIGRAWRLTVTEDSGPASFPVRTVLSAGPGESAQTMTLSVVGNSNPSLFSSQPSVVRTSYGLRVAFTPASNRNGWAVITVRLSDNGGTANGGDDSTDRTFRIRVVPLNDPPNAVNDLSFTVKRNAAATPLAVLANDTSAPDSGETLTITATTNGAQGTVAITGGGTGLTYKPATGFTGTDTFTYTLSDGNGGFDTATVVVTVVP